MKTEITEQERKSIRQSSYKYFESLPGYHQGRVIDMSWIDAYEKGADFALSELRKPSEDLVQEIAKILTSYDMNDGMSGYTELVIGCAKEISQLLPSSRSQENGKLLHRLKLSIMAHPDYHRGQKGDEWHDLVDSIDESISGQENDVNSARKADFIKEFINIAGGFMYEYNDVNDYSTGMDRMSKNDIEYYGAELYNNVIKSISSVYKSDVNVELLGALKDLVAGVLGDRDYVRVMSLRKAKEAIANAEKQIQ